MELFANPLAQHILGAQSKVLYSCDCHQWKPISKLYFCKHCTKLRCANCVAHEVDSFFCPNCLENMPSAEAKLKKNRCANCFDCPSCGHTLSVRATTLHPIIPPNPLEESSSESSATLIKKMHYLYCSFCRWTSRDVGLPDQATPSGGWPEQELPYSRTMLGLLDYYKQVAHHEKMEKERQKMSKRRSNIYIMDRYGYGLSALGKKASSLTSYMSRSSSAPNLGKLEAPKVSEVMETLPLISDSYYADSLFLEDILMLDQRLHEPGVQARRTSFLYPKHKHLMVRRSQRCTECEHNIFKPEFNPSSIKFKIQLGCIQYCPILQLVHSPTLTPNKKCQVVFCITNPLDTVMNIRFEKIHDHDNNKNDTASIDLPTTTLIVAAKDATVEFDVIGTSSTEVYDDDPTIIQLRSTNKLCVYVFVKPSYEQGDVISTFKMLYEYKMMTTPLLRGKGEGGCASPPKPEEHLVSLPIYVRVNFGKLNETSC